MDVKMVSYSQGTDGRNLLEQVAYVARVSNPANQNNNESAEKLVRYLIKHQHWSPLEMVNVCLEINTTRDIARQILRHRSFSFQEFSQRYAVVDFGIAGVTYAAEKAYNWAIENGIAKEQARVVLPEGLTASRLYMNGTLRSWVHYIQLRSANGTQKEHQEIAIACAKAIEPIFPMIEEFVQQ